MPESPLLVESLRRIAAVGLRTETVRPVDLWCRQGLEAGKLHDIYAADADDAPAAIGFTLAAALAAGAVPIIWLRTEEAERKGGRIHGGGLNDLGLPPAALIVGVVADEAALLRAGADAARCAGLGMLIVECRGRSPRFDLTATRRLMLAAERSGVTIAALRIGTDPSPSAAATRWGIAAHPSRPLAAEAPGAPAFTVDLLRQRGGPAGARWHVEWNRDAHRFEPTDPRDQSGAPPLSGAGLPLVADRAVAHHPRASVRRAG